MTVEELLLELKNRAKQLLAAALFLSLLLGASAGALALLAAGVSALSSSRTVAIASVTTATGDESPSQGQNPEFRQNQGTAPVPNDLTKVKTHSGDASTTSNADVPTPSTNQYNTAQNQGNTDFADDLNNKVDHMHSPIGEAINNGGVVLGNHIQHAFGNLMAGILRTLFLEQSDNSTVGTGDSTIGGVHG